ncbi:MAG: hypothetical protein RL556_353 [Actinomycetota bacterium]|jgi:DNA processing protein
MPDLSLKIPRAEIDRLVSAVGVEDHQVEAFAAAAISHFTEPADRFSGALAAYLGYPVLLAAILNHWSEQEIAHGLGDNLSEIEELFNCRVGQLWSDALQRWLPRLNSNQVRNQLQVAASLGGKLIDQNSSFYVEKLQALGWAKPHVIWLRGNPQVLEYQTSLALVGSRIMSSYGQRVAVDIAATCSDYQVTTISGGAFGVDAMVHRASLEQNSPTIAVMAGGLDGLYPRGNSELFAKLLEANAIIAEVPPGVTPAKWRFLQRNRIIAALSDATVVVEAGIRSGSISTAKHAIELARQVGVVPGSIYDSAVAGCLKLLRENPESVSAISRPEDAMELVGISTSKFELDSTNYLGALETRALDAFGSRALTPLDVQRIAGLTTNESMTALGSLELLGMLERSGATYRKVRNTLEA